MVRCQSDPDWNLEQLHRPGDRLLHRRQRHECHCDPAARDQCRSGQDVHCERRVWSHFDEWTLPSHRDTFRFESHRRSDVVHHRSELRRRKHHVDRKFLEYFLVQRRVVVRPFRVVQRRVVVRSVSRRVVQRRVVVSCPSTTTPAN